MNKTESNSILDQLVDTFYRTDVDGVLTIVSASVITLLGYSSEEILGTSLADYYADRESRQEFLKKLDQEKGRIVNQKSLLRHKNGEEVWVATSASYYFDDQGRVAGVEGITRDITLQKQLEDEATSQNRQLEKLIEKRTISLQKANEQLEAEVTERRLTETELNDKTILLDNILRNANEMAIATTDLDFRITYYNPHGRALIRSYCRELWWEKPYRKSI